MSEQIGSTVNWRINRPAVAKNRGRFQVLRMKQSAGSDSFLWSLADLMTLLLVFFIMLYSNAITQPLNSQESSEESDTSEESLVSEMVDGVFSEYWIEAPVVDVAAEERENEPPSMKEEKTQELGYEPSREPVDRRLLADLEGNLGDDLYVRWEDRQPIIVLGERITFKTGEAHLLIEARDALGRIARLANSLGPCRVIVTGHTDNRPIHTDAFPSNWELSAGRAASVAKALMMFGVSPGRIVIQGQSQFSPLAPNTDEDRRRANRRVEISLIKG